MRFRCLLLLLLLPLPGLAQNLVWYADAPRAGLQDWSWTTHNLANTSPVHAGTNSISMEPDNWGGVYLVNQTEKHRFTDYQSLTLWVHGGSTGGQQVSIYLTYGGLNVAAFDLNDYISGGNVVANQWRQVTVPFDATTTLTHGAFDGLFVMDDTGGNQGTLYLDDLQFNARGTPLAASPLSVSVNLSGPRRAIRPEIYGVNFGDDAQHVDLRYPLRRSGGNSTTRYNWQSDSHNTAFDWFWQNIADGSGSGLPGNSTLNEFVATTRANGGQAIVSIPTIGLKPIGDRIKRWSFSIAKYGPQDQNECSYFGGSPPGWCSADAGNGECQNVVNNTGYCVNGLIINNDIADTSVPLTNTEIGNWITHLATRPGAADAGVVRWYALDNEPMLWNSTHRDVHPVPPTYDEVWTRGRDVALAIKQADPAAKVLGPVTWGWCDLFSSAADAAGGVSCIDGPDRQAHGGLPFVEWYVKQVCDYATAHGGLRLVDALDVHFYPQGNVTGLGGSSDSELPADSARRLRSLRELYDPAYTSESWVDDEVRLIPRLREWIDARCPGLDIALTEYKWGPDEGPSGALAQAEALAIFGREGVDVATRWVAPETGSLSEDAFRMFLDYDGANTRVLGDSIPATASNGTELGAYAIDQPGQALRIVLINRATAPRDISINLSGTMSGNWQLYRFDAFQRFAQAGNGSINGTTLTLTSVPGRSANLLVLPASTTSTAVFADGFE
ncbi:MAG: glycoside hydrolase family 44 protein [Xanthomonadales bacterium]|nr:glycoside hydrolase family 44 protein [Xanthomonadales bacterium]MCC6561216.1 glycoside hydrolase family 44 protein [Xanthomonadales bacterium]